MKKRLIALLACAALLFALCAGCASDKPSDKPEVKNKLQ